MEKGHGNHVRQEGPCNSERQNVQDNDPASYAIWYGNSGSDQGQGRKMEVAEMKMLRFSLGKTRLDRIENAVIRGKVKVGELVGKIRESRLRWFGHVERREDSYVGWRVETLQTGRRRRARPKRRWKVCISEDLRAAGLQP